METATWKLTLPYVKDIDKGNLWYAPGNSNWASYQPRGVGSGERWEDGSGRKGHVYRWLIHVDVWQKSTEFC